MQIIVWRVFRWVFGAFYLISGLHWGVVLLAWHFRTAFYSLWNYKPANG